MDNNTPSDLDDAAEAMVAWYREHPDMALLLLVIDNEIALMTDAEAMNDGVF
jgi:hypothetical protein